MFIKETKNQLEVFFDGEMDHYQMSLWKEDCQKQILNSKADMVVFDFKAVSFIDSTGIGFIIGRYSEIKRKGGSIVICSMNSTIKKVFNISGLKRICSVAYDEVSADKILGVIA